MYRSYHSRRIFFVTLISLITMSGCRRPTSPKSLKAKREHARESGSLKPQRRLREMTEDEVIKAAAYYEKNGPQELAIAAYQRVINVSQNPDHIAQYLKKLADVYLAAGNYKEAKAQYHKFMSTYPGHPLIIDARYQEIKAHFLSSLSPQKDQSATHQVIKLGKHFLADYLHNEDAHQKEVVEMLVASYKRLIAYELNIAQFYLNKFSIDRLGTSLHAAFYRVFHIITKTLPDLALCVPEYQSMLPALALPNDIDIDAEIVEADFAMRLRLIHDRIQAIEAMLHSGHEIHTPTYFRDKF